MSPLEPDPELAAVAAARKAINRNNPRKANCSKCKATFTNVGDLKRHDDEEHPIGRFTPELQEEYLERIRTGGTLHKTARDIGLTPGIVSKHLRTFPEYAKQVELAEEEAAEYVEMRLRDAALDGEPWAVKDWLKKRASKRWADAPTQVNVDVNGHVTHELVEGGAHERLRALTERALARKELAEANSAPLILDAEIVEDE